MSIRRNVLLQLCYGYCKARNVCIKIPITQTYCDGSPMSLNCLVCRQPIGDADPVYREARGYSVVNPPGPSIIPVCATCSRRYPWLQWRPPQPCHCCGRTVILSTDRKIPTHIVCGEKCRTALFNAMTAQRKQQIRARRHHIGGEDPGEPTGRGHSSGNPALRRPAKIVVSKSMRMVATAKYPEACRRAMLE